MQTLDELEEQLRIILDSTVIPPDQKPELMRELYENYGAKIDRGSANEEIRRRKAATKQK